jgi:hypothetical protein
MSSLMYSEMEQDAANLDDKLRQLSWAESCALREFGKVLDAQWHNLSPAQRQRCSDALGNWNDCLEAVDHPPFAKFGSPPAPSLVVDWIDVGC